ncbi:MAG: hypothetical protein ACE5DM_02435 [Candidatus Nanoarchaeia archaeon]
MKRWFKSKSFGYGWTPCSWEGWAVTLGFVATLIAISVIFTAYGAKESPYIILSIALAVAVMIKICFAHGEKPKWSWGKN